MPTADATRTPRLRGARPLPIVLLTDFGPHSAYAGQMRLVLARLAARSPVFDLAHDLPSGGVAAAALTLDGARAFLPTPAIVCAVVDPGVGSARRILAARFAGAVTVLAPDNGILPALRCFGAPRAIRAVTNERLFLPAVSPVFHGRDIFAPVAACLAAGRPLARVGPAVAAASLAPPPWPTPRLDRKPRGVQVVHVDRFGNLITNLRAEDLSGATFRAARCVGRRFPFATHYAAVRSGGPLALIGSFGCLELALRGRSAAAALRAGPGTPVEVET